MCKRQSVISCLSVAFALLLPTPLGLAQSTPESKDEKPEDLGKTMDAMKARMPHWFSQYQSNGAQMTSVPAEGQPGADFFSNGADATSVGTMGPASQFFTNGEAVTSVGGAAQSSVEYFRNGMEVTNVESAGRVGSFFSNGAEATSVPKPNELGGDFFSRGADANSPKPGEPGWEFFSNGAQALSPNLRPDTRLPPPPSEPEEEQKAVDAGPAEQEQPAPPDAGAQQPPAEEQAPPEVEEPQTPPQQTDTHSVEVTREQSDQESEAAPATDDQGSGPHAKTEPPPRGDGGSEPRAILAHAVDVFATSVLRYVGLLLALLAVLAAGVAWRIHRLRARKRLADEERARAANATLH